MSAVEDVLEGLIVVFCTAGMVMGTICAGWLLIDAFTSLIRKMTRKRNAK